VNWFAWPSRFWAVGPTMLETIFDGGRRRATSEGALANYDATVANYRQTTLVAFQEVEDNLAALRILEHEALQQREAVAEAERGVEIFTNRYQLGVDPYLQVVSAETMRCKTSGTKSTFAAPHGRQRSPDQGVGRRLGRIQATPDRSMR
jgi:outer membrane protein TolC